MNKKQRDCLNGKPCESRDDCQKSYKCVEGRCCKNSDSGDSSKLVFHSNQI